MHSSRITIINRRGYLRSTAVGQLILAGFSHAIQAKSGISCIRNMEKRRLVEIPSQKYDVRTLIIFSKYPFFIRYFRSQFYQFLNQILDALTVDSKRLQLLRTKWREYLDLATNHFSQSTTAKETSLSVDKHLFFFIPASCSLVHNWHLCRLTIHDASAILNGTGPQIPEHSLLQCKIFVFHSKPFRSYYTDLCSQSLWRQSNGDVTVNILIHQMTSTCTNMDKADWKGTAFLKSFHTTLETRQPSNQWVPVALAGVEEGRRVMLTSN